LANVAFKLTSVLSKHCPHVQAMEQAKASTAEAAPSRKHAWSVLILASTAVLREGIESVIFLAGAAGLGSGFFTVLVVGVGFTV
jgi:high-affinity Fe2+/Pb2+ permease